MLTTLSAARWTARTTGVVRRARSSSSRSTTCSGEPRSVSDRSWVGATVARVSKAGDSSGMSVRMRVATNGGPNRSRTVRNPA